jgi:hypothetical protein
MYAPLHHEPRSLLFQLPPTMPPSDHNACESGSHSLVHGSHAPTRVMPLAALVVFLDRTKNSTRQLHEAIVVMWLCKCEVEPTENCVCQKPILKCLN